MAVSVRPESRRVCRDGRGRAGHQKSGQFLCFIWILSFLILKRKLENYFYFGMKPGPITIRIRTLPVFH